MNNEQWTTAVELVEKKFYGQKRKCGAPMASHSIDVAEILKEWGADDVTVLGGLYHDLLEDSDITQQEIAEYSSCVLQNKTKGLEVAALVNQCSYSDEEYALPKLDRKTAACKRWGDHEDFRVALVKSADIKSNKKSAYLVSPEFETEYMAWAGPLETILDRRNQDQCGLSRTI